MCKVANFFTITDTLSVRELQYDKSESNPTSWTSLPTKWDGNATFDINSVIRKIENDNQNSLK